MVQMHKVNA